jgi:hypothetical protein
LATQERPVDALWEAQITTFVATLVVGPVPLQAANFLALVSGALIRVMPGRSTG